MHIIYIHTHTLYTYLETFARFLQLLANLCLHVGSPLADASCICCTSLSAKSTSWQLDRAPEGLDLRVSRAHSGHSRHSLVRVSRAHSGHSGHSLVRASQAHSGHSRHSLVRVSQAHSKHSRHSLEKKWTPDTLVSSVHQTPWLAFTFASLGYSQSPQGTKRVGSEN